jgi:hypothetical protein
LAITSPAERSFKEPAKYFLSKLSVTVQNPGGADGSLSPQYDLSVSQSALPFNSRTEIASTHLMMADAMLVVASKPGAAG